MATSSLPALAPVGGALIAGSATSLRASSTVSTLNVSSRSLDAAGGRLQASTFSASSVTTTLSLEAQRLLAVGVAAQPGQITPPGPAAGTAPATDRQPGGSIDRETERERRLAAEDAVERLRRIQQDGAAARDAGRSRPGAPELVPLDEAADDAGGAAGALQSLRNNPFRSLLDSIDRLVGDLREVFKGFGLGEDDAEGLARQAGPLLRLRALAGGGVSQGDVDNLISAARVSSQLESIEIQARQASGSARAGVAAANTGGAGGGGAVVGAGDAGGGRGGFGVTVQSSEVAFEFRQVDIRIEQGPEGFSLSLRVQSISLRAASSSIQIAGAGGAGPGGAPGQAADGGRDPLILDLDGNGVETTSLDNGRIFDLNGDGRPDLTAFVGGNDALLALDRDGNGRIDSGRELFGDQNGARDGFAELAKFDDNRDGAIDADDRVFGTLKLLYADGRLGDLSEQGVARIVLDAVVPVGTRTTGGETLLRSTFAYADGRTGIVDDVNFDAKLNIQA